jgi:hypothetical protein
VDKKTGNGALPAECGAGLAGNETGVLGRFNTVEMAASLFRMRCCK